MPQRRTDSSPPDRMRPGDKMQRPSEARRLIAGLRVSHADEQLLALIAPFFPEADSAGDLAYRLWRRGLELAFAELVSVGAPLPAGITEDQLATLVAQRVAGCLPLLRRTGKLALLQLEVPAPQQEPARSSPVVSTEEVDASAAVTVVGLGGADFL